MLWHNLKEADLEAVFEFAPRHTGADEVGRRQAFEAWRWLTRSPAFDGALFFNDHARPPHLAGCGAAAFVESSFAEQELADPRPGLNARIVASIVDNRPVVLTYERLREANARGDLQLVTLSAGVDENLREDEVWRIAAVMSEVFVSRFVGYNIARMLYEAIGRFEVGIHTATAVERVVRTFDSERALTCITPESAGSMIASKISTIFLERRPILRLGLADQELLLAALDELTDDELSERLNAHIGTIKKRWTRIFDRVSLAAPSLVADCASNEHLRGKQKRHRVLAYVREHPEELRPYDYGVAARSPQEIRAL